MVVLKYLFNVLVFPGLLFSALVGLILSGLDRKIVARMQKRIGPPIIQPIYDFFKLLGKETIVPRTASRRTFLYAPVIGLLALVTVALFVPIYKYTAVSTVADIIVVLYLLTIPAVALIMGGAASGSPYAGVGISREMVAIISYELPLVIVLLTIGKQVGMVLNKGAITFSLSQIVSYQADFGPMITNWKLIPAALALLLIIPIKVGSVPFDIAEAESEICEGPLVEYSGAPLAIFKLNHAIKMFIMTSLFVTLFLSGKGTGILILDILLQILLSAVIVVISISTLKAITARLKVEQVLKFFWTYPTALAIISLILVWIGR